MPRPEARESADSVPVADLRWVEVWSAVRDQPAWRRVLALVEMLAPTDDAARPVADWPIGAVAARALAIVEPAIGGVLRAGATCRACGQQMETELPVGALRYLGDSVEHGRRSVHIAGHEMTVRAVRPRDLARIAGQCDVDAAAGDLLERCLTDVTPELPWPVPAELVAEIEAMLEQLDPLAVVVVDATCPTCGTADSPVVDLLGFAWTLFEARALRLLGEVHRLALAYGWTERDVLSLDPTRRAVYLELVQ